VAINFRSMLRDEWSVSDLRFESDHRVGNLVICSRGLNKTTSGTVLLVYGTGKCLCTVVSDRVSRFPHVCVLAIEIGKRIRSQLEQQDASTYLRIAFLYLSTKLQP
jgi:hypothetical protein